MKSACDKKEEDTNWIPALLSKTIDHFLEQKGVISSYSMKQMKPLLKQVVSESQKLIIKQRLSNAVTEKCNAIEQPQGIYQEMSGLFEYLDSMQKILVLEKIFFPGLNNRINQEFIDAMGNIYQYASAEEREVILKKLKDFSEQENGETNHSICHALYQITQNNVLTKIECELITDVVSKLLATPIDTLLYSSIGKIFPNISLANQKIFSTAIMLRARTHTNNTRDRFWSLMYLEPLFSLVSSEDQKPFISYFFNLSRTHLKDLFRSPDERIANLYKTMAKLATKEQRAQLFAKFFNLVLTGNPIKRRKKVDYQLSEIVAAALTGMISYASDSEKKKIIYLLSTLFDDKYGGNRQVVGSTMCFDVIKFIVIAIPHVNASSKKILMQKVLNVCQSDSSHIQTARELIRYYPDDIVNIVIYWLRSEKSMKYDCERRYLYSLASDIIPLLSIKNQQKINVALMTSFKGRQIVDYTKREFYNAMKQLAAVITPDQKMILHAEILNDLRSDMGGYFSVIENATAIITIFNYHEIISIIRECVKVESNGKTSFDLSMVELIECAYSRLNQMVAKEALSYVPSITSKMDSGKMIFRDNVFTIFAGYLDAELPVKKVSVSLKVT